MTSVLSTEKLKLAIAFVVVFAMVPSAVMGKKTAGKETDKTLSERACDDVQLLIRKQKYDQALTLINKEIDREPNCIKCLLVRSEVKYRLNKFHGSIRDAQDALEQSPNNVTALQLIGRSYRSLKEPALALKTYERALKLDPKNGYTEFICANLYFAQEKWADAEKHYAKAAALIPNEPMIHLNRADNLRYMHRYDEALKACDRAIEIKPDFWRGYNIKGIILYYSKGDKKGAIRLMEKSVQLNPRDWTPVFNLAVIKDESGDRQGAINTFTKAIELDPGNFQAYNNRGNLYSLMGDYARARQDLDRSLQINPRHLKAIMNRARVFAQMGQLEESMADYEQAQKLLSAAARRGGEAPRAPSVKELGDIIDGYTRVLSINKKDSSALYNRGCAYFYIGKFDQSTRDFETFYKLNRGERKSSIFSAVFYYIGCSLKGDSKNADKLLVDSAAKLDEKGWPEPLVLYLLGKRNETQLLKGAKGINQETSCHFVIGMKQIIDGRKESGMEHLRWVTARGEPNMDEYMMSVCQLAPPSAAKEPLLK